MPRSLIFCSIVIVIMGVHHVEHGHKLSNYEASFLPLYHTKRGYMGIGEGWIYSKSFLCTKQAAFCSLFMPVIIKICVFAFVYSASLVETTCGLFPIFRWSGVPTRVPARNIEIDLFSSADNQPTLLATALWIYYLVFTHGNTKIYQIEQDGARRLSDLGTFFNHGIGNTQFFDDIFPCLDVVCQSKNIGRLAWVHVSLNS